MLNPCYVHLLLLPLLDNYSSYVSSGLAGTWYVSYYYIKFLHLSCFLNVWIWHEPHAASSSSSVYTVLSSYTHTYTPNSMPNTLSQFPSLAKVCCVSKFPLVKTLYKNTHTHPYMHTHFNNRCPSVTISTEPCPFWGLEPLIMITLEAFIKRSITIYNNVPMKSH